MREYNGIIAPTFMQRDCKITMNNSVSQKRCAEKRRKRACLLTPSTVENICGVIMRLVVSVNICHVRALQPSVSASIHLYLLNQRR